MRIVLFFSCLFCLISNAVFSENREDKGYILQSKYGGITSYRGNGEELRQVLPDTFKTPIMDAIFIPRRKTEDNLLYVWLDSLHCFRTHPFVSSPQYERFGTFPPIVYGMAYDSLHQSPVFFESIDSATSLSVSTRQPLIKFDKKYDCILTTHLENGGTVVPETKNLVSDTLILHEAGIDSSWVQEGMLTTQEILTKYPLLRTRTQPLPTSGTWTLQGQTRTFTVYSGGENGEAGSKTSIIYNRKTGRIFQHTFTEDTDRFVFDDMVVFAVSPYDADRQKEQKEKYYFYLPNATNVISAKWERKNLSVLGTDKGKVFFGTDLPGNRRKDEYRENTVYVLDVTPTGAGNLKKFTTTYNVPFRIFPVTITPQKAEVLSTDSSESDNNL
jgi:hypothetical protein